MVEGTNGDNTLTGTPKADTIRAYGGEDVVRGLSGRDKILAGKGRDRLYGARATITSSAGTSTWRHRAARRGRLRLDTTRSRPISTTGS
jgi:Ca2+-binding RTX toxin-like protein